MVCCRRAQNLEDARIPVGLSKMATSGSSSSGASGMGSSSETNLVPLIQDQLTFEGRQAVRLEDMKRRLEREIDKKKKDWEKDVHRMREEFLTLHPVDRLWGSEELLNDPLVIKRRGSTDTLDPRKMKTMFLEYPDTGNRRFKLRFDVRKFDTAKIKVTADHERITVRASAQEPDENGEMVEREYIRKLEKPHNVDSSKVKSFLTSDRILIVDCPLPPQTLNLRKVSQSPSHSSHGSRCSFGSSRSRSPSNSPRTPIKVGVPAFSDCNGKRHLVLQIEIGHLFKPNEITVQVIKDNRLQVKAKHEERTSERLNKNKFNKEYDLSEKIVTSTLRAGLDTEGKLHVGAIGKGHLDGMSVEQGGNWMMQELRLVDKSQPCNVMDLANFPPVNVPQSFKSSTSNLNASGSATSTAS